MDKMKGLENETQLLKSHENGRMTRDLECAGNVGLMASLGCFDSEFNFWGCTYKEDNVIKYRISGKENDLIEFIEQCIPKRMYPSSIHTFSKRCPVPAGAKETISQLTKIEFAQKLYRSYSIEYYNAIDVLASYQEGNCAEAIFSQWADRLEGRYLIDELKLFEITLNRAYASRIINWSTFFYFSTWLTGVYEQMEDDVIVKDLYHRAFYGIGYLDEKENKKFKIDAQKEYIYRKKEQLENEGYLVTPIFEKNYWFHSLSEIRLWKQVFEKKLMELFDERYFTLLRIIKEMPSGIPKDVFEEQLNKMKEIGCQYGIEDLKMYGHQWNLL